MTGARLQGRRILIAGGGSGIGRATAILAAREGARITVTGRRRERLEDVAEHAGGFAYPADLRDSKQVRSAVEHAERVMGGLDGLVSAVGVLDTTRIASMDDALWDAVLSSNLTSTFMLCREALPYLRASAGGAIVNVAALAGIIPGVASVAYSAAKAGIIQFSHVLASQEVAVRVNSICPGAVDTDMTQGFLHGKNQEEKEAFTSRYACRRLAEPDEIARLICFMISNDASYVTGSNFVADGGRAYR